MTINEKVDLIMRWIAATGTEADIIERQIKDEVNETELSDSNDTTRDKIEDLLKEIGIRQSILGFKYTVCAIELVLEDETYAYTITKRLYPTVAEKFETTGTRVERSLRHAIETVFNNYHSRGVIDEVFGNSIPMNTGKPTNSEFIAACASYIRRQIREA